MILSDMSAPHTPSLLEAFRLDKPSSPSNESQSCPIYRKGTDGQDQTKTYRVRIAGGGA